MTRRGSRAPKRGPVRAAAAAPASTLALVLLLGLASPARAGFFNQLFTYACPSSPLSENPTAYLRWSKPGTWTKIKWGGSVPAGAVPGVGRQGALKNVTIPCGARVLLDVPRLNLTHLDVRGLLRVEDPVKPRVYQVFASFISVEGQLAAGTFARQLKSKIAFMLMPNPKQRLPLLVPGVVYPDKDRLRGAKEAAVANVGHKAFAVVGGQVDFHGMPGSRGTPSWVRLRATAREGTDTIVVDQNVAGQWPRGGRIAIAATDYNWDHAEEFSILSVRASKDRKSSVIKLSGKLAWRHWGVPVSDGMGGWVDQRAEVALLSRNIIITGLAETGQYRLEGGHFIVHQTLTAQRLEGVEFWRLGQQGTLGRYNIHFHVCADTRNRNTVYKNSIHDSLQRCVVIHATHNLTVEGNVAYNTSGHCFLLEEGGEQDNTIRGNLVISTRRVEVRISQTETDHDPSSYWVTNIKNAFYNNVAAGSESSGFWTELRGSVRGMSLYIPDISAIRPLTYSPQLPFVNNVAHSNFLVGFRAYPHGIRSQDGGYYGDPGNLTDIQSNYTITGFLAYKHRFMGIFLQASGAVVVSRSTFADNQQSIFVQGNNNGVVEYSRFVGWTSNTGTPVPLWQCQREYGPTICAPAKGCQYPPTDPGNTRALNRVHWKNLLVGVYMTGISYLNTNSPMSRNVGNTYALYDATCRPAAGVAVRPDVFGDWWDAATAVGRAKSARSKNLPVWLPPNSFYDPSSGRTIVPQEALIKDLAIRDPDGGIVGGRGGYIVKNDPFLLPPRVPKRPWNCSSLQLGNAFACPGTCYRTVIFRWTEPGFEPYPLDPKIPRGTKKDGDFSYIVLQRTQDKLWRSLQGNLQIAAGNGGNGPGRWFHVTLLAGATYNVWIRPGTKNASFFPPTVTVEYGDGWSGDKPCPGAVYLRFMPRSNSQQWSVANDNGVFHSPCPGLTFFGRSRPWPVYYQYTCYNAQRILLMRLNPNFVPRQRLALVPSTQAVQACTTPARCGVVPDEDWYQYADNGKDYHPRAKYPGYRALRFAGKGWKYGKGIIGFYQYQGPTLGTKANIGGNGAKDALMRTTFYFRRKFTVSRLACMTNIVFDYYPVQGLAIFLNNVEAFRFSLPPGVLNYTTVATTDSGYSPYAGFLTTPPIPLGNGKRPVRRPFLRKGVNILAYELHVHNERDYNWFFDSTASFTFRC